MKELFENYMNLHCGDLAHIGFYQGVWKALMILCELRQKSLDAMPKRCPMVPPRMLKVANLDFVDKIKALYLILANHPPETNKDPTLDMKVNLGSAPSIWRRFGIVSNVLDKFSKTNTGKDKLGSSPSTDGIRDELATLDGVLRNLSVRSSAKEGQILSTVRELVELMRVSKEDERFRLTCTRSGEIVYSHPPKISTITDCLAESTSSTQQILVNGVFSIIRHDKILLNSMPKSATLIALDLSLAGLKGRPVDHDVIEISYKDEPCGSQKELQASRIIEPHGLCGLRNGCLVTEGYVLAPATSADGQTYTRVYSLEGDEVSAEDKSVCWEIQASTMQSGSGWSEENAQVDY